MTEGCTLRGRGDRRGPGEVELVRASVGVRAARSAGIAAVGLVFGGMVLPVPGLHLIAWVPPVVTGGIAWWLWRAGPRVERVSGPCPACGGPVEVRGLGLADAELWIRCDACGEPLVVELSAHSSPGSA